MRIAVAGKGGAGKTTVSATLARVAADHGMQVICVDADSNPNLHVALGVPPEDMPAPLPPSLVSRRLDGPALTEDLESVLDRHAVTGPAGIRLGVMGMPQHAEEGCLCSAHAVVRATLADLGDDPGTFAIVDMEASPEHFSRGTARHVDALLLVTEPYFRSLETVRRMAELASELPIPDILLVGNKVRDEQDRDIIEDFAARHDLPVAVLVPWGDAVIDADRARTPLADAAPDHPVVAALHDLFRHLIGTKVVFGRE
jgi:CO dehydrogenase maturation factor